MKGLFFGLILGAAIVIGVIFYYSDQRKNATATDAKNRLVEAAHDAKNYADSWGLSATNIREELARTGQVIRNKSQEVANTVSTTANDVRISNTIRAKLVGDPNLSALNISVHTTEGKVTLGGTTSSPENIQKAMTLALNTEGVRQVVSTIQLK